MCTAAAGSTCSLALRSLSAAIVVPQISPMKPNTYIQRRSISGAAAKHTHCFPPLFFFFPRFFPFLTFLYSHFVLSSFFSHTHCQGFRTCSSIATMQCSSFIHVEKQWEEEACRMKQAQRHCASCLRSAAWLIINPCLCLHCKWTIKVEQAAQEHIPLA